VKQDSTFKAVVSNLGTSIVQLIIGLFASIIVTRTLGQEGKGLYNGALLLLTFYAPILMFGYLSGVLFHGLKKEIDINSFFFSGFTLVFIISSLSGLLLVIAAYSGFLGQVLSQVSLNVLLLVGIATLFNGLSRYCNSYMRIGSLFHASNLRQIAGLIVTFLCQLVFYLLGLLNVWYAILGFMIGQMVEMISGVFFVLKYIKPNFKIDFSIMRIPVNYGLKAFTGDIVHQSNNQLDKLIVSFLLLPASFGIYVVGVGLANLTNTLPASYVNVLFNQITATKSIDRQKELFINAQRITIFITTLMAIGLFLLGKWMIFLLYGGAFAASFDVLWLYAIGLIFYSSTKIIIKFYSGVGKPLKSSAIYLFGFITGVPSYFFLVPTWGLLGAAVASSLVYFLSFAYAYYHVCKEFDIPCWSFFEFHKINVKILVS